jgi:hypothetical protein
MRLVWIGLIGCLLLGGCATLANTPAQDRASTGVETCRRVVEPGIFNVTRIEPDGRVWLDWQGTMAGSRPFWVCLARQGVDYGPNYGR